MNAVRTAPDRHPVWFVQWGERLPNGTVTARETTVHDTEQAAAKKVRQIDKGRQVVLMWEGWDEREAG